MTKKFKFSTIIAIYNTEDFLAEAIESVINQSIGFEDIELILVNDGSQDSSEDICLEYQEKYPDNIQYIYQENQGQATARNNAMKHANGKYLNFLDSDDKFELNAFELVYDFFEKNYDDVDLVSIPIVFFDRRTGDHILNYKYESTRLVDLIEEPSYVQFSASAAFFKKEAIGDNTFDKDLVVSEDSLFLNKIMLEKNKMGVISGTAYLYRKREELGSTVDSAISNKDYYLHRSKVFFKGLFDYCKNRHGELLDFIKYTIMYDIQWMFDLRDLSDTLNEEEFDELCSILHELLDEIDDEIILDQKHRDKALLYNILAFKYGEIETIKDEKNHNVIKKINEYTVDQLYYHVFYIDAVEVNNDKLEIIGFLKSFFKDDEIKIQALKYDENEFIESWVEYFNENKLIFINDEFLNIEGKTFKTNLLKGTCDRTYYSSNINNYMRYGEKLDFCKEFNLKEIRNLIRKNYIDSKFYHEKYDAYYTEFIENNSEIFDGKRMYYPYRERTYMNFSYNPTYNFEFEIPLEPDNTTSIKIRVTYEDLNFYLDLFFNHFSKLTEESFYSKKENYLIKFQNNTFFVNPYSMIRLLEFERENINHLSSKIDPALEEVIRFREEYYYTFFKYRGRRIWLFMDRPEFADDNAEHMFKYALKQDDGIEKYYILSKESKDYERLSEIGNVVDYGSKEHKLLACHAEKIISSHPDDDIINPFYGDFERYYNGLFSAKLCFLQHGIILNNISSWLHKYDKYAALVVTTTKKEYQSFFDNPYNYSENVVQLLGLPRFDNLKKGSEKNQIVIMPTWRRFLSGLNDKGIKNSEYFNRINSFLNNEELIEYAKEHDYEILFKPHLNLHKYLHLFDRNDYVKFDEDTSYQTIFKESKLMITDYSSVAFDFAYMKKPLIYYQTDDDKFHFDLDESYFKFKEMGFGELIDNEKELVEQIKKYIDNDCEMDEKYKKRVDDFYEFTDDNNCKRVYSFILGIKE